LLLLRRRDPFLHCLLLCSLPLLQVSTPLAAATGLSLNPRRIILNMTGQHAQLTEAELQQLLVWSDRPSQLSLSALNPAPTNHFRRMTQQEELKAIAKASRLAAAEAATVVNMAVAEGTADSVPFAVRLQAANSALNAFYDANVLHHYVRQFNAELDVVQPGLARAEAAHQLADRAKEAFAQAEADAAAHAVVATEDQLNFLRLARRLNGADVLPVQVVD
jgi:hypothetical protein